MNNTRGDCKKCGRPLEMYYKPWCPVCDKPEKENLTCLNLIQCLNHIEATNHRPEYKDRMWKLLFDDIHNDSYMRWVYNMDEEWDFDEQTLEDITLFNETFDIKPDDNIVLEVSW